MEKRTREYLRVTHEDSVRVTGLSTSPLRPQLSYCFYDDFALKGIRVHRFQPGFISCFFKVPPRLTDRNGDLAMGAIANLVDRIVGALLHEKGAPLKLSVDISISFLSTAKVNDELEISAKFLGRKGAYNGSLVVLRNKASGEIIAEGRHSMFSLSTSKL